MKALVWFVPEEPGPLVTMHAYWGADNGYETSTFPTKQEAIDFCWRRWRIPVSDVRVDDSALPAPAQDGES